MKTLTNLKNRETFSFQLIVILQIFCIQSIFLMKQVLKKHKIKNIGTTSESSELKTLSNMMQTYIPQRMRYHLSVNCLSYA